MNIYVYKIYAYYIYDLLEIIYIYIYDLLGSFIVYTPTNPRIACYEWNVQGPVVSWSRYQAVYLSLSSVYAGILKK